MIIYSTETGSQAKFSSKGLKAMKLTKKNHWRILLTVLQQLQARLLKRELWWFFDWWWWNWWNGTWPKSWVLPKKANGGYFLRRLSDVSEFQVCKVQFFPTHSYICQGSIFWHHTFTFCMLWAHIPVAFGIILLAFVESLTVFLLSILHVWKSLFYRRLLAAWAENNYF